jgi:hypothetical protein
MSILHIETNVFEDIFFPIFDIAYKYFKNFWQFQKNQLVSNKLTYYSTFFWWEFFLKGKLKNRVSNCILKFL